MSVLSDPHLSLFGLLDSRAAGETSITDIRSYYCSYGNTNSQLLLLNITTNNTKLDNLFHSFWDKQNNSKEQEKIKEYLKSLSQKRTLSGGDTGQSRFVLSGVQTVQREGTFDAVANKERQHQLCCEHSEQPWPCLRREVRPTAETRC
ncbi:hypothetical protein DPMN_185957 [Dreissena polymorpha]|uniref:Uncharacterized protein n=1 Tax=Dreissena polymorpha TaxID=45954 RepID=A0A9D4DLH2_DREPO|nr:hypothetical protein DPMN_185957 [Dreissena polymorpha]